MSKFIEINQNGNITEIFLNRPELYNAFNIEMITELAKHLTQLATDNSVRGITITGKGKAFCAGGDLKWAVDFSEKASSSFHTLASQSPPGRTGPYRYNFAFDRGLFLLINQVAGMQLAGINQYSHLIHLLSY